MRLKGARQQGLPTKKRRTQLRLLPPSRSACAFPQPHTVVSAV